MNTEIVLNEKYQLLPPMPPEQFEALKQDIDERGVLVPIDITDDGLILDGHHRYRACVELGIKDFPTIVRPEMSEGERRAFARQNNILRRHLTRAQVRELIRAQLRETPEWANNRIGKVMGVDQKTVQTQRKHLESTWEIPKLSELVGADGKTRKPKRPAAIMAADGVDLRKILEKLAGLHGKSGEGFFTEQTLVLQAPDPEFTEEEEREWEIAFITKMIHPEDHDRIVRAGFRTPSEWFGPEGHKYNAWLVKMFNSKKKVPSLQATESAWRNALARFAGRSIDGIRKEQIRVTNKTNGGANNAN